MRVVIEQAASLCFVEGGVLGSLGNQATPLGGYHGNHTVPTLHEVVTSAPCAHVWQWARLDFAGMLGMYNPQV